MNQFLFGADEQAGWEPDEQCTACHNCRVDFTVLNRRHHCRNCKEIFCGKCSDGRAVISPGYVCVAPNWGSNALALVAALSLYEFAARALKNQLPSKQLQESI
jgi:hypothetical protein